MSRPVFQEDRRYTYADLLRWPADQRWELIEGVAYAMTAPSRRHQGISAELTAQLRTALRGQTCQAYAAPFDIRLPEKDEKGDSVSTVVQPDLSVICDSSKLDNRGCCGAPDFIVEIISPGTASRDLIDKLALYERHGVREYWILHPADRLLMIHLLHDNGTYGKPVIVRLEGTRSVSAVPGLDLNLDLLHEFLPALDELES